METQRRCQVDKHTERKRKKYILLNKRSARNAGEEGLCFPDVLFFNYILSDFYQTNYLNIDHLQEICTIGGTFAVDKRSEVTFSIPQETLPWQPILWAKSTSIPQLVFRTTFARAAPPALDKLCMTQANKLGPT